MLPRKFTIGDDFPPVGYQQWRALAEAELHGAAIEPTLVSRTYDGIEIRPLYTLDDQPSQADPWGFPGAAPFARGSSALGAVLDGWDVRQEHADPDLEATRRAIEQDVAGGVTSLQLRLDRAASRGWDADHPDAESLAGQQGIMAYHVDDLDAMLAGVDLDATGIALDAGAAFVPAASILASLWRRRGCADDAVWGALNADPLSALAREGVLPYSIDSARRWLAKLATWCSARFPRLTAVGVDTSPYHHAGATSSQDLGLAMATAVEYLRAMTGEQPGVEALSIDQAAGQILFRFSVGTHHFLSIAKLRAARRMWQRIIEASGGSPSAGALRMQVRTGQRALTRRDPYVNLLRNTVGVFSAAIAGADAITSVALDATSGPPDDLSRRIARNTPLILQEEGHLHRVIDPAGGSWYLDCLTDDLAQEAWRFFQAIERRGGMFAALLDGWVAQEIDAVYAARADSVARRRDGITGVSQFPHLIEEPIHPRLPNLQSLRRAASRRLVASRDQHRTIPPTHSVETSTAAAAEGASIGQLAVALGFHQQQTSISPLERRNFAEPFEELRDASDAWHNAHGYRPRVFLANLGPASQHAARAAFASNFFEAGGFQVLTNDGFADAASAADAFQKSGASIAVICGSDESYRQWAPDLAGLLCQAAARCVVLAGNPGAKESTWRSAGVDRFIFDGCDVLATLSDLLRLAGVMAS